MSLIPNTAISSALTPIQRATHDQIQARRVQSAKNFHHSEEVDELDETAVNSVRDDKQQESQDQEPEKHDEDETEEKVEIKALGDAPQHLTHNKPPRQRTSTSPPDDARGIGILRTMPMPRQDATFYPENPHII